MLSLVLNLSFSLFKEEGMVNNLANLPCSWYLSSSSKLLQERNASSLSSKQPKKRMVTMKILPQGQEVRVKCRLAWTWSWLQARLKLKYPPTSRYGAPQQMIDNQFSVLEYTLNPSRGQQGRAIINLFLTDICSNNTGGEKQNTEDSSGHQEEKKRFDQYLSEQPPSDLYLGRLSIQ